MKYEILHTVLGALGNVASVSFFLSSTPTAVRMVRLKSTEGLSGDLYAFTLFNCLMWMFYGLPFIHPRDLWVFITNTIGSAFAIACIVPYLVYAPKTHRASLVWKLILVTTLFVTMVVVLVCFDHSQSNRILIVGVLCSVISSSMHITLLSQCRELILTKDPKYLHPIASTAAFIKGLIWMSYGFVDFDMFIIVPNGIGVLIGTIQVILVIVFVYIKQSKPSLEEYNKDIDEEKSKRYSAQYSRDVITSDNNEVLNPNTRYSLEMNTMYNNENLVDQSRPSPSVSRVSSLLSLSRQSSNVIVPIEGDFPM